MLRFLLMPLLVYVPVGIYLFFFFRRFLTLFSLRKNCIAVNLAAVLIALAAAAWGWMLYGFGAVVVLHFTVLCLILEVVNFLLKGRINSPKAKKYWTFFHKSGLISIIIIVFIFIYGYFNINNIKRVSYTIETSKELTEDLTIVQISDLHMGNTMDTDSLREVLKQIEAEKPDLLALTGDIFDESTTREEMAEAVKAFSDVKTAYGVFYVFGNHDYNYYVSTPLYTVNELREELLSHGIHVLEDQTETVTDWLTVAGRSDLSVGRRPLNELLNNVNPDSFVLLLDHQPKLLSENMDSGADLQLSGHTHAGQIWPTGLLGSLTGGVELNYGLKKMGDYQVLVSSGIAGWGYPIRTGGHSEYVVITVKHAS